MFAVNFRTKSIISYAVDNETGDTTFPRGEWLVDRDYILTGLKTRKQAEKELKIDRFKLTP